MEVDPDTLKKQRGINWKMTAKTILVQLHHKIQTFEAVNRKLVLVVQDKLIEYMQGEFAFNHVNNPSVTGNSMHFHAYSAVKEAKGFRLNLTKRLSTDAAGVTMCLGLQAEPNVGLADIFQALEAKMSEETLLKVF